MLTVDTNPIDDETVSKKQVAIIAKEYAKKHNLCSVVDQALRDIGIDPDIAKPKVVRAKANITLTFDFTTDLDLSDFSGLDETEQNAKLLDLINEKKVTIPTTAIDNNAVGYVNSIDEVDANTPGPNGLRYGFAYSFTSNEGRVRHIIQNTSDIYLGHYTLCNYGVIYGDLRTTSTRDEGRVCAGCSERYGKL